MSAYINHTSTALPSDGPFARIAKEPSVVSENECKPKNVEAPVVQDAPTIVDHEGPIIEVNDLTFRYCGPDGRPKTDCPPVLQNVSFSLPKGARCLLIGPNGAGKTTLLKILAGQHMVGQNAIKVLGRSPFHDTGLVSSGDLSYIGGSWERDIAFAGYRVPIQGDVAAGIMLKNVPNHKPHRRLQLLNVLDIHPNWHMHSVSDGQRRRVQLAMGLIHDFKMLLLDEITVDLDVLARAQLMEYLTQECISRNTAVIYATHIFDGMENWPTHIAYLSNGVLRVQDWKGSQTGVRLYDQVYKWLKEEDEQNVEARALRIKKAENSDYEEDNSNLTPSNNGWIAGRAINTSMKHSANAVLRN